MNSLGTTLVSFVFVLGVLIFIHELGHYLVAKYLGIRVEVFSLGFGKRLFGFTRGDTDYRISLIPLGGYVKMSGENPDDELHGTPDEFLSRPKLQRFAVAIAGPVMNIGLAILLMAVLFMLGSQVLSYKGEAPVLGAIRFGSPAEEAGLEIGDRVVSVDGEATPTWRDLEFKIATSPGIEVNLHLERDGERLEKRVKVDEEAELGAGEIGVQPFIPYVISAVNKDSPAERAGLQAGDEVEGVFYRDRLYSGFHMVFEVVNSLGVQPITFRVRRGDEVFDKTIQPEDTEDGPRIGAYVQFDTEVQQFGLLEAFGKSVEENIRLTKLVFTTVARLVTGQASIKQMSGPIEIAKYSGMAAQIGWTALLSFMALVSLQLGILNLLPIPVLDGGVILLLLVEGMLGRDLSLRAKERIFKVGFLFIVLLMVVVIYNDIAKNLPF